MIDYEAFRGGVHILNIPGCKAATDSWDRNKIKIPARVVASADIGALGTPAQRRLALHKAKLAYFTGGPGNIDIAVALFTWLLRVVPGPAWYASLDGSGIEAVDAFDKFRKSTDRWAGFVKNNGELAAQHERYDAMLKTFYNLKPQLTANADQWSALANSVAVQVTRLAQGLDYFGHPWNWTPVVPVDAYKTEGDRLLAAARRAEDLYNKFAALDKDQAKRKQVMQGAINDSDGKVAEIEAQIAAKITARLAVTTELDELKADLLVQEKKLQDEALVFVTKLREELQSESLAAMFTLLKDGIGLVTDVAKLVMSDGLSAAIGTLSTDTKAVTDNNKDKDKDKDKGDGKDDKKDPDWGDLFGSLSGVWDKGVVVLKDFQKLSDIEKQSREAQKTYGFGNAIIMLSRDEFDKKLEPVFDKMGDEGKIYKKIFGLYRDAVENYQGKFKQQLILAIDEIKLRNELAGLKSDSEALRQKLAANIDPGLSDFRIYIYGIYTDAKAALLEFIYQEYQALRYGALIEDRMVLKGDSTVVELESAHMKVSTRLIDAYNSLETPAQTFTRLTVVLTRETFPQQFQKLAEGGKAIFPLSWDNPVVVDKLHDYAHILVSSCRIHLPLARKAKTSGDVHVLVMHSGQSAIFDSKGKRWDFSHVITSIYYDYNVESKEQKKEVKPTSDSDYVYNTRIKKTVGYKYNVEHMTDKGGGTFCPQDKRIKISPLAVWAGLFNAAIA